MSTDCEARLEAIRAEFARRYEPFVQQWVESAFNDTPTEMDAQLRQLMLRFFLSKGKALRPLFLIVTYQMERFYSGVWDGVSEELPTRRDVPTEEWIESLRTIPDNVWDTACALEIFHGSLLAIDDLLDHGTDRRGQQALHLALEDWASQKGKPKHHGFRLTLFLLVQTMVTLWNTIAQAFAPGQDAGLATPEFCQRLWPYLQKTRLTSAGVFQFGWRICDGLADLIPSVEESELINRVLHRCHTVYAETLQGEMLDVKESFPRRSVRSPHLTYRIPVRLGKGRPPLMTSASRVAVIQFEKTTEYSADLPIWLGVSLVRPGEGPFWGRSHNFVSAAFICYAHKFGQVFQMADDLLIVRPKEEIGKDPMSDLRNGSLTTVTAAVYENMPDEDGRRYWSDLLGVCGSSDDAVAVAMEIIRVSGVIDDIIDHQLPASARMCDIVLDTLFSLRYDPSLLGYIFLHGIDWMDDARHGSKINLEPHMKGRFRHRRWEEPAA